MIILWPLGFLYGKIADVRNALYDRGVLKSYSLGARTISIGNITTGGTGKTPLVAYVAEILSESGEKVCILTRGYGRENARERVLVSDGESVLVDAKTGGDEPVELARKLVGKAIVVADADRVLAAAWAKEKFSVTAFVLDDGFQHRRAKRDLDIVCIDATNPFGMRRMLPAGKLRERSGNLDRADTVVITRSDILDTQITRLVDAVTTLMQFAPSTKGELDQWYSRAQQLKTDYLLVQGVLHYVPPPLFHYLSDADIRMKDEIYAEAQTRQIILVLEDLKRWIDDLKKQIRTSAPNARIFLTRTEIVGLRSLSEFESNDQFESNERRGRSDLSDGRIRIMAFCALGNPDAFFAQLSVDAKERFELVATHAFSDHHQYTRSDVSMLHEKALHVGASAILTTAKDAVKLTGLKFEVPCYVVDVDVGIDDSDDFRRMIKSFGNDSV